MPPLAFSTNPLVLIAIVAIATRFYDIHEPAHVCWDETHFGKMASWYINRTFFFDVHPPLGKMLIALSGSLSGYDGKFAYEKPGDEYENWTQYIGMRVFCASLGMLLPVITYSATKSISGSQFASSIASILVLFDNGLITLTRYILLDSPLLFFISTSTLGLAKFSFELSATHAPESQFSAIWWFWLIFTGLSIASAFSVKFVGLFIVSLVGFRTIHDLWLILGDIQKPISYFFKHLLARILCLILIPICLYSVIFYMHLYILNRSGNGDGFYSSSFQSQLIGNSLHNSSWPAHLAYGAEVTLKNHRIGGAYLHSHWHLYPEGVGARQQQVTGYSHKDSNNKWIVKRSKWRDKNSPIRDSSDIFVRNGDLIELEHLNTKRNLHSHFEQAPITKRHYQVTCYGQDGQGDANDIWRIQLIDQMASIVSSRTGSTASSSSSSSYYSKTVEDRIFTVRSRFILIHYLTNCALHSHSRQLPKWGYDQLEVTCNPKLHQSNNYWNIEDNYYPDLANVSFESYAPTFLDKFIESHAVMLQGNAGLKPKEGEITSRPWQWPINYKGQFFSASKGQKVYLLGNPIIWWLNLFNIILTCFMIIILIFYHKFRTIGEHSSNKETKNDGIDGNLNGKTIKAFKKNEEKSSRKKKKNTNTNNDNNIDLVLHRRDELFIETSCWLLLAWILHYVPFYFMGRVLYFHHYFPAFIFSCMLTGVTMDFLLTRFASTQSSSSFISRFFDILQRHKLEIGVLLSSVVIYTYCKFIPITYGTKTHSGKVYNNLININGTMTGNSNGNTKLMDNHFESSPTIESSINEEQKLSSLKWLDSWDF